MRFLEKKDKLDFLLVQIKKECTGNANSLSTRICVSRRTLLRYINELRDMGHYISFCQQRNTYYLIKIK